jgi:NAD(P)-dependent dehydrogenase (short-subunit alcohol dehydrogenase family)
MKSAQNTSTSPCKVAIVTGASSGIGLEMVKRLIEKGYRVVANSRKITSAMTLHGNADLKLVDGDIGVEETAKRVVSTAIQSFSLLFLHFPSCELQREFITLEGRISLTHAS